MEAMDLSTQEESMCVYTCQILLMSGYHENLEIKAKRVQRHLARSPN